MNKDHKVLYSGMQATGNLTLGNYLGALKNWVGLADEYECYYGVMDLHSLTVRQDPPAFRAHARELMMIYIAAGIDPEKNVLYLQSSMRRYAETIERLVNHDIMTGMINRRGFMTLAPAVLEQARREGRFFVLISADMDHMKQINDEYGHLMGDEAICRMGEGMRVLESRNMTPVHISGDEFLAFGIADSLQAAEELVPLIHAELKRQNAERPWIQEITTSLGMYAAVPKAGEELDRFLTRADRAMYADKTRKKGRSTSG